VFLAFGVRAVGDEDIPRVVPHDGGRACRVEAAVENPDASGLGLLNQRIHVAHYFGQDLWRWRSAIGLINAQQVLLDGVFSWTSRQYTERLDVCERVRPLIPMRTPLVSGLRFGP
jgi:hypothetical protein